MDLLSLAEYGAIVVALGVIVYQAKLFTKIINNHLHDNKDAIDKNTEVLGGLKDIMKEVHYFLKRNNGKK